MSFSFLVSLFTLGLSAASQKGAVLYPLRQWMESFTKKLNERYISIYQYREQRKIHRQAGNWIEPAINKMLFKLWYKTLWHKPLLTCGQCMPSFWSVWLYLVNPYMDLWMLFLCIPMSSYINYIANKRL